MSEYELYRSKWRVTQWKDDCVYRTEYVETNWFDQTAVEHPNTVETNVLYSPPEAVSTDEERRGIRRKARTTTDGVTEVAPNVFRVEDDGA